MWLFSSLTLFAQHKKIKILHSDNTFKNQEKYPGAIVALGHVMVEHEGATLQCNQALIYQESNLIKAFGNVLINQGDTLTQHSKFVSYNGNTKIAKSWGNVILKDPEMTLTTDTLDFDRTRQLLYYKHFATIRDSSNTLHSEIGNYYLNEKKFQAISQVVIDNADHKITSHKLDYYTSTGISNLYGPTTILDKKNNNTIYSEKGYHNSKTKISHFVKNAKINYKDRIIKGDSLYYDEHRKFASATGHISVLDTINNSKITGGYAEYFQAKDSIFIIQKPVAISLVDKDSMYIHGDRLLVTGKQKNRILRAYHHVKFFKENLQGKCDSLYTDEQKGITKMYRNPVLWSDINQITGDSIQFITDTISNKLDSLKVYSKAFVIKKDSSGGYSQIKGKNLFARFKNDTIQHIYVSGNGQMINYNRNEKKELIGITKLTCSNIKFKFDKGTIINIKYITKPTGKTYPPSQFPQDEKQLPGFIWRIAEQPKSKEDIFRHDPGDDAIIKQIRIAEQKAKEERIRIAKAKKESERLKTADEADKKKAESNKKSAQDTNKSTKPDTQKSTPSTPSPADLKLKNPNKK